MSQEENQTESKNLIVFRQYDHVEMSLIKEDENSFRLLYSYVKQDKEAQVVTDYCTIITNIVCSNIADCVVKMDELINLGIFHCTIYSQGVMFDKNLDALGTMDWTEFLGFEINQQDKITIH